jgi:hypothetical protein
VDLEVGRGAGGFPNPLQIQEVFEVAERILAEEGETLWIAIDELDKVAINGGANKDHSSELLSALMHAHSELYRLEHIRFKFFIRSDVYEGLTYVDKDYFSNAILELGRRLGDYVSNTNRCILRNGESRIEPKGISPANRPGL